MIADLTVRDWMIVVGGVLIVGVLLETLWRLFRDRRETVRLKLAEPAAEEEGRSQRDVDIAWLKELPNGGARVVTRKLADASEQAATGDGPTGPSARRERPTQPGRVAVRPETKAEPQAAPEPRPQAPQPPPDEVELLGGISSRDEPENLDWLDALEKSELKRELPPKARLPRDVDPEVFMLNVVSRDRSGFRGDDIMQILLACGLRFGDMSFFHRHEHDTGRGPIQFSVANMLQPGVFDIDNMSDFSTQGLVFFVTLPGPDDMMKAFDYMLETAQAVARNLNGDVLDETRSALTRQSLEHSRQKIRDLERRLLAQTR
ncbi:MAG: cell division protein ZipA [Parahaliea sp.]